jgi:cyclophilin family peptidyl-prolyl cis-trans isomerase
MRILTQILILFAVLTLFTGCNAMSENQNPRVRMETSKGTIEIELFADKAPKTVENFVQYVKDGQYNGTIFHRVIPGFMIQGGGFTADMSEKATRPPIRNEANNGQSNELGTIAMARTPDPHSASAQFFINVKDNDFLDFKNETTNGWGYCVFGKVIEGMDVVNSIVGVPTGNHGMHQDVPLDPIIIEKATVVESD